jgi:autotransporter translocation and assembly factor TamB
MRRMRWIIPVVMLLAIAVVAAMPFTAAGTRLVVAAANKIPGLSVEHSSGTLFAGLELSTVGFVTGAVDIDVADLRAKLDPGCLWESRLCFTRLSARSLRIAVLASDGESSDAQGDDAFVTLPFGIRAPELELGSVDITWPGGSWRSSDVSAGVAVRDERVRVRRLAIVEAILDLGASDDPSATERIELPRLFLPLELDVAAGRLERGQVIAAGEELTLDGLALSGAWRGERLRVAELSTQLRGWGEGMLSGELRFNDDWPLDARLALQFATDAALPEQLRSREATLDAEGSLGALDWSLLLPGENSLSADGALDVLQPGMPFSLDAELAWRGQEALSRLVTIPPALAELQPLSPVTLTASGDTARQVFELRGAASGMNYEDLEVDIRGAHQDGRVSLARVEVAEPATASSLSMQGELNYAGALSWELLLETPGITLPALSDYVTGRLQGGARVTGSYDGDDWQSTIDDVSVTGTVNELPADLRGDLALGSGELLVSAAFEADINGADVALNKRQSESGRLDVAISDLGRWVPGAEGSLELDAFLGAARSDVTFSGRMDRVQWQDVSLAALELSGRGDLVDDMPFEFVATADGLGVGRLSGEQAQLSLRGDRRSASGEFAVSGDVEGLLQLAVRAEDQIWKGSLATDGIATPAGTWRASEAVEFAVDTAGEALSVAAHCWRTGGSSICIDDLRVGEEGAVGTALDLELALFEFLLPAQLSVSGRVVGRTDTVWDFDTQPEITAAVEVTDARLEQQLPEGEIARFSIDRARLALEAGEIGGRLQVAAEREGMQVASIDVRLAASPDDEVSGTMIFDDFRLGALRPFVPQLSRLSGQFDGELELYGTTARPLVRGSVEVSDGHLSVVGNPNALEGLTLAISLAGEQATLSGTAQLGGGPATLAGDARWGSNRSLAVRLQGQRNRLLVPPYSELLVSSGFDIRITPGLAEVEGQVTVHEGRLEHEQLPAGSVAVSEDVIEVDYAGKVLRERAPFAIRSRVRVLIEDNFRVVGSNIDATVGGDLRLQQEPERPMQVFGTLNVIGGEVRAYGQRLTVAQGSIDFSGDPDNPQLNLRAERDIPREGVLVGVIVTGTLEEPLLEIYSEPGMPQTAALSWLVRGRGPDAGAGADGTAMAIALGASAINQTGVVSEINRIPGISNVRFGAEDIEDDTAATVSGYIGERIYVSYGVGIYEPINVLTARLYLQARLWLEVVSRLENSVDLYYSFDID